MQPWNTAAALLNDALSLADMNEATTNIAIHAITIAPVLSMTSALKIDNSIISYLLPNHRHHQAGYYTAPPPRWDTIPDNGFNHLIP